MLLHELRCLPAPVCCVSLQSLSMQVAAMRVRPGQAGKNLHGLAAIQTVAWKLLRKVFSLMLLKSPSLAESISTSGRCSSLDTMNFVAFRCASEGSA